MPCDENTRGANYQLFIDTLNSISQLIHTVDTPNVLLGGDWNCDMSRVSPQVNALKDFLNTHHLKCGLGHTLSDVTYTYESKSCHARSTIDHFMLSGHLYDLICEYTSPSDVDNLSDHNPVLCKLDADVSYIANDERTFVPRSAWHKASETDIDNYKVTLTDALNTINIDPALIHCDDIRCTLHHSDIYQLYDDIVLAICTATDQCIPTTCNANEKRKVIPGWNDHVKDKKNMAELWNFIWQQNGKPRHGTVADIMRKTKRDYHYAIRYCKKNEYQIASSKMDQALLSGRNRELWGETTKLTKQTSQCSSTVDGTTGTENIAELFDEKFKCIYKSVPYSNCEMDRKYR